MRCAGIERINAVMGRASAGSCCGLFRELEPDHPDQESHDPSKKFYFLLASFSYRLIIRSMWTADRVLSNLQVTM